MRKLHDPAQTGHEYALLDFASKYKIDAYMTTGKYAKPNSDRFIIDVSKKGIRSRLFHDGYVLNAKLTDIARKFGEKWNKVFVYDRKETGKK